MQIIKILCKTSSKTLLKIHEIIKCLVKSVFFSHIIVRFQFKLLAFLTFLIALVFPIVLVLHALFSLPNIQVSK